MTCEQLQNHLTRLCNEGHGATEVLLLTAGIVYECDDAWFEKDQYVHTQRATGAILIGVDPR